MEKKLYAEVVIDNRSRETDRIFNYSIPDDMLQFIKPGIRVLVPFGKGNKRIEAYVLGITDSIDVDNSKLKLIEKLIDKEPVISGPVIDLIYWMREKYLCCFIDAIKAVIPTPIRSNIEHEIILVERDYNITNKGLIDIIDYIDNCGGKTQLTNIKQQFKNPKLNFQINKLKELGIIEVTQKVSTDRYEKKEKLCYICESIVPDFSKRANKQIIAYNIIKDNPGISYSELREKYSIESAIVSSLIKKQYIYIVEKDDYRSISNISYKCIRHDLTDIQKKAFDDIMELCKAGKPVVLHGVTGSGKTEVYFEVIEQNIMSGRDCIVLVPEISLTPQMINRFRNRFGDYIAVLHSGLSEGEKSDQWRRIKKGLVKIVIGARSAVFAPFNNLGIIIIDEEHEHTYKSEISPKYITREVAQKRCELEGAGLILGSATPAIETYYKTRTGEYGLVELLQRVNNKPMPLVKIIDMREELKKGNKTIFSEILTENVLDTLKSGNQMILFLNRRGYSTFVSCRDCGIAMKCPRCSISLTYHMSENKLTCHYCGFEVENPANCPKCKSKNIRYFGVGTQKVEKEFQKKFGIINTLRMDADTTSRKNSHELILDRFRNKLSNVLIGTQMISKGLDFPGVTLVGIITADTSINLPDFRAAEKTFQMIEQVAGRSGRGEKTGLVIVQTYSPEHYSVRFAKEHDYIGFYNEEIEIRRQLDYPPFATLSNIVISGLDEKSVIEMAKKISDFIDKEKSDMIIEKFGPSMAPIGRIKSKHRWQIILKGKKEEDIKLITQKLLNTSYISAENISINIDINPVNML